MELTPPYYVLSFIRNHSLPETADVMLTPLSRLLGVSSDEQPGFLGMEPIKISSSAVTKTYWQDLESIRFWKMNEEHLANYDENRKAFFGHYRLEISKQE